MEEHYRKLEHMYSTAPVNEFYQPTLVVDHNTATVSIQVLNKHFHAAQAAHGSIYFKMLDDAAFFAAQSVVKDVFVLTTQFNTHLLRPIFEEQISATGTIIAQTKSSIIAESILRNRSGKICATGRGIFALGNTPLSAEIGYHL